MQPLESFVDNGVEEWADKENVRPVEMYFTPPSSPRPAVRDPPDDDPLSPFAKLTIPDDRILLATRSAPVQAQSGLQKLRSSGFKARQLSFKDWCLEPISNGSPERRVNRSFRKLDPAVPEISLHAGGVQDSEISWKPKSSVMQPTLKPLQQLLQPQKQVPNQQDALIPDEGDLLSCDESLSYTHLIDYAAPSLKRRRSCSTL